MPYAPTVNDRSGEILAGYQTNAANTRAQGMQNFGQSIGEGLESMGSSIAEVITKKQEDASKATSIGEALNTMQSTLPTYGAEGVALQQIITKRMADAGNNLDKMSGIYMAFQPAMQNLQSRFNQNAQALNLAKQKAALGIGGGGGSSPMFSVDVAPGVDED